MSLTRREAVIAMMAGEKVTYRMNNGDSEGIFSPLSWSEDKGVVDSEGDPCGLPDSLTHLQIAPSPQIRDVWVTFFRDGSLFVSEKEIPTDKNNIIVKMTVANKD
jgi:hypothetical protein